MSLSVDRLRELSLSLVDEPDKVLEMTPEELSELRKYVHPYGNVTPSTEDKLYVNISIINWRDTMFRKFYLTAASTFMYRMLNESEAPEADKAVIRGFLDHNFAFDADRHVRSAHTANRDDPERKPREEIVKSVKEARKKVEHLAAIPDSKLREYSHNIVVETYQTLCSADNALTQAHGILAAHDTTRDYADLLCPKIATIRGLREDAAKYAAPISADKISSAVTVSPPVDVFHHFGRFVSNNYEALREVCEAVYAEKPDIEYTVILHSSHKTEDEAREYRIKHNEEFKTDVLTIESGCVCLLGPFKGNRDRVDFYNSNTEVIKRMAEQMEADHKLGKDLMEKRVKVQKALNVAQYGPDAPGLSDYVSALGTIEKSKNKAPAEITPEERAALEKATAVKEDFEVPSDAIQVDVFAPRENAAGDTVLEKSRFYTRAEAPLHMQDNSEFRNHYQPISAETRVTCDEEIVATAHEKKPE